MAQDMAQKRDDDTHPEELFSHVGSLAEKLSQMETFVARRFDELSMEINATSQQIDFNEDSMQKKFSEIFAVLKAVSFMGDGSTAANTGVELDAVINVTENAANTIMDAADRISERASKAKELWGGETTAHKAFFEGLQNDIEEIFTACSFQDITGQRIRTTLSNLKDVEERLGDTLASMGIDTSSAVADAGLDKNLESGADQSAVDDIFAEKTEPDGAGAKVASQDDIDSMFD